MALMDSKIIACTPLINGFQQITLENAGFVNAKPGNYIEVEEKRWYILKQDNHLVDCIIDVPVEKKFIRTSSLKGEPKQAPDLDNVYLLTCNLQTLAACLFYLREYKKYFKGLVLIEANGLMPFRPCPSRKIIPNFPADVIGSVPLLEDWGISNRIANTVETPGCFYGTLAELIILLQQNDSMLQYHQLNF